MKAKTLTLLFTTLLLALGWTATAQDEEHGTRHEGECKKIVELHGGDTGAFGMHLGSHGYLGVGMAALTPELVTHFGVAGEHGVLVSRVEDDSPAATAGLQVGDVVTRVDGEDVTSTGRLAQAVRGREGGDVVDVEYWRDGKVSTVAVTLDERERCGFDFGHLMDVNLGEMPHLELDFSRLEHLPEMLEFNEEAMGEAMKRLEEVFESGELEGQLKRIEEINLHEIEEHMERIHERLRDLEVEIEEEKEKVKEEKDEGDVY